MRTRYFDHGRIKERPPQKTADLFCAKVEKQLQKLRDEYEQLPASVKALLVYQPAIIRLLS